MRYNIAESSKCSESEGRSWRVQQNVEAEEVDLESRSVDVSAGHILILYGVEMQG